MFGHHYIPIDNEIISDTDLFKDEQEHISPLEWPKIWLTTITTEGDEVQVIIAIDPFESGGHSEKILRPTGIQWLNVNVFGLQELEQKSKTDGTRSKP